MKPVSFLLAITFVIFAKPLVMTGNARPAYNAIMTYQYHLREDVELRSTCKYCHIEADGGDVWNSFGVLMREVFFAEGKRLVPETLYETLKRDKDSDKDGFRDILEVVGKSLPGDPKSVPEASLAELEAKLKSLGGVDYFKPIVARQ